MNDNDIIKALECCRVGKREHDCKKCPLYCRVPACMGHLTADALDLITRQKAEIEALKLINSTYCAETKTIRDIAFREFAENVKKNRRAILNAIYDRTEYSNIVDNLVKEMTEEKE